MEQGFRKKFEIIFTAGILAFFILFFFLGLKYPPRPRELPLIIDVVGLLLTSFHLVTLLKKPVESFKKPSRPLNWKAINMGMGSMFIYLISSYFIGMVLSSAIIVFGCGLAFGAKNKKMLTIVSVVTVVVVYLLFVMALKVRLFPGIFFGG